MITYRMSYEEFIGYALSFGIQNDSRYVNPDGSIKSVEEIIPFIKKEYEDQKVMDHFSILLLKDRTGANIQQVLEKNGSDPVQISSGSGGVGQYEPKGVKQGDTPIYKISE